MATVITEVADIVNLALARMGYKLLIGHIYDGSEAANLALTVYSQTRDELMRDGDWDFAKRTLALELLKQAPPTGYFPPNTWSGASHPPPGWLYEYTYPSDCLRVKSVVNTPLFGINFDPRPNAFTVTNDNYYTPARRVILCNVPGAFLNYVGQVTNPSTWDPGFTEAFASALGQRLAPALKDMETAKLEAIDAKASEIDARGNQG